jgi:hypothetical protein
MWRRPMDDLLVERARIAPIPNKHPYQSREKKQKAIKAVEFKTIRLFLNFLNRLNN